MAICNTVVVAQRTTYNNGGMNNGNEIIYEAESSDEYALVEVRQEQCIEEHAHHFKYWGIFCYGYYNEQFNALIIIVKLIGLGLGTIGSQSVYRGSPFNVSVCFIVIHYYYYHHYRRLVHMDTLCSPGPPLSFVSRPLIKEYLK